MTPSERIRDDASRAQWAAGEGRRLIAFARRLRGDRQLHRDVHQRGLLGGPGTDPLLRRRGGHVAARDRPRRSPRHGEDAPRQCGGPWPAAAHGGGPNRDLLQLAADPERQLRADRLSAAQRRLPAPNWLGQPGLALLTLIVVDTWQWTPFVFIILAGGLATIPGELDEAAAVDGANSRQRFLHITLPLLMPYVAVAVLFRSIDALKTFDSVQILTSGGPGSSTTMLNYWIFKQGISFLEFGKASASAVVFLIVCILLANALLRMLYRADRA